MYQWFTVSVASQGVVCESQESATFRQWNRPRMAEAWQAIEGGAAFGKQHIKG